MSWFNWLNLGGWEFYSSRFWLWVPYCTSPLTVGKDRTIYISCKRVSVFYEKSDYTKGKDLDILTSEISQWNVPGRSSYSKIHNWYALPTLFEMPASCQIFSLSLLKMRQQPQITASNIRNNKTNRKEETWIKLKLYRREENCNNKTNPQPHL